VTKRPFSATKILYIMCCWFSVIVVAFKSPSGQQTVWL